MAKFIFITGGVVSSLGKGLASAALATLLQSRGFNVRCRKLDPYLNVDPGTMSPFQHGEVFVTDDGAETDLDLGHYERFTGVDARKSDNVTTGQIYSTLLAKERRGEYLGGTVQVIPHVTDLIKQFVLKDTDNEDFVLCEIGGTVGDIEALPYFEAIRQLGYELGRESVLFMHVTLVPWIPAAKELKTKPTQHSAKELRSIGIVPDIILCRADREIPIAERRKIALFCNLREENVMQGLDATSIYDVPRTYHAEGLDTQVLKHFGIDNAPAPDLSGWQAIANNEASRNDSVNIAIVGKYTGLNDAYKSLNEALHHASIECGVHVNVQWVDARTLEPDDMHASLSQAHAILVPGGFGERGVRSKIASVRYAREHKIPYFGICFGMQMAVIEYARNVVGIASATSSEFDDSDSDDTRGPLVGMMTEWMRDGVLQTRGSDDDVGGTMRLGAYECTLEDGSLAAKLYGESLILERHRHRYEVNIAYKDDLEAAGLRFSGMSPSGKLPEIVEIPDHPWFVAVQFHPEFKSRPFAPHPLFSGFVKAAMARKEGNQ